MSDNPLRALPIEAVRVANAKRLTNRTRRSVHALLRDQLSESVQRVREGKRPIPMDAAIIL